jgi:serine/threonine protein kinase
MATPGTLIADRYRLVRQLGAGGMGVVWEARDERLHRPVAVKQLRTQVGLTEAETEVIAQRAMREARINASLQHPYAVAVFDVVEHEGQPCIVMELVPSVPLSEVMRGLGQLAPAEAARVGSQVASALAAAHSLGIVHRDVKPGNVLIGDDGTARICDFGISRSFGDATLTMTGMITGTPAYLAPETARGEESTSASDVHSLGATLYAAVEGEPPFGSEGNAIAVLYRVTAGEMRPPERAGALEPLLLAMMSLQPGDRPTMAEASARLSDLAGGGAFPGSAALPPTATASPRSEPDATEAIPAPTRTLPVGPSSSASPATRGLGRAADDTPRLPAPARPAAAPPAESAFTGAGTTRRSASSSSSGSSAPSPPAVGPASATSATSAGPASAGPSSAGPSSTGPSSTGPSSAGSSSPSPRPPVLSSPRPAHRSRRGLVVAIVVLALLVAAVGVALLWPTLTSPSAGSDPSPGASRSDSPTGTTESAEPSPSEPDTAGAPTTEQLAQAVTDYYALLPDDTDAGWDRLTSAYQRQTGGRESYEEFWKDMDTVSVSDVRATAPDRVQATITYVAKSGNQLSTERRSFRLVDADGVLKINASAVV